MGRLASGLFLKKSHQTKQWRKQGLSKIGDEANLKVTHLQTFCVWMLQSYGSFYKVALSYFCLFPVCVSSDWVWAYLLIRQVFPTARSPTTMTLEILNLLRKKKAATCKYSKCPKMAHPWTRNSWFPCSPHGAGALLLTGSLHFTVELVFSVESCLFLEVLRMKDEFVRLHAVWKT